MNKARRYAELVASGEWPQDKCEMCRRGGGCCKRAHHHLYDCCLHCGNDERNLRVMKYRGLAPNQQRRVK